MVSWYVYGHTIEVDDTPGYERLNITHKSGSYIMMDENGDINIISNVNNTEYTEQDKFMFVNSGDLQVQVINGKVNIVSKDKVSITSSTAISIQAPIVGINP